ncbi:MAG: hypothetical protein ACQES9_04525 [Myxococcota bacterium]
MKKFFYLTSILLLATFLVTCDDDSSGNNTNNENNHFENLELDDILDACIIKDACEIMRGGYIAPCVTAHYNNVSQTHTQPIWNDLYRCVLKAGSDCDEVRKCFGAGEVPVSCDPATDPGYCDGNIRYYCDNFDNKMYAMDCAVSPGWICAEGDDEKAYCTESTCDDASFPVECDGDLIKRCENGIVNMVDCAVVGLACQKIEIEEGVFQLQCMGSGGQCDPEQFEGKCEGNTKVTCNNGIITSIDCPSLPGDKICEMGTNNPHCNPAGQECEEGEEMCDGSFISKICLDGYFYERDCRDLGFRYCTGMGVNEIGAHCTH